MPSPPSTSWPSLLREQDLVGCRKLGIIDQEAPGNQVTLTINRSGKTITIKVTLGTAPTSNSAS
jgi:hypothetical protein